MSHAWSERSGNQAGSIFRHIQRRPMVCPSRVYYMFFGQHVYLKSLQFTAEQSGQAIVKTSKRSYSSSVYGKGLLESIKSMKKIDGCGRQSERAGEQKDALQ
jgi:hypothetical protein